jgi:hypothetical protein
MPGPHNAKHKKNNKGKKKQQQLKKAQHAPVSETQDCPKDPIVGVANHAPELEESQAESRPLAAVTETTTTAAAVELETHDIAVPATVIASEQRNTPSPRPLSAHTTPKDAPSKAKNTTHNHWSYQVIACPPVAAPELQLPYLHNPGTGPRVRAMRPFLASTFASAPSWDDPLCAEFAQEEVLQMLCTLLPEEIALVSLIALLANDRNVYNLNRKKNKGHLA